MKAPSEFTRNYSKARGSGVIELNKMIAMEAKLDAIMHRMDKQDKKLHSAHEIGAVDRGGIRISTEGSADEDPYAVEEANYLNEQRSCHFKPNPNLPTHYNPALRNHENFSYGGGASQGQREGRISSKGIIHQGSNSSKESKEMNIKVRRGPGRLRSRCCSSWGITKSCFTPMNRNLLSWKLKHQCFPEEIGNTGWATDLDLAEPEQECIP